MTREERDALFSEAPIWKAIRCLVLPTVLGQLTIMVYNLTDTYFVGQTGDPAQVAAVSLAFPLYHLLNALSNLFGIGGASLISRLLGAGSQERVKNASAFCFWGALLSALLYALVLELFMEPLLRASGASSETLAFTASYMHWAAVIGSVPTMLSLLLAHLLRSDGYGAQAGIGMTLGSVSNILLDPVFVLVFGLGVTGAAIATCLSNLLSALYFLLLQRHNRGRSRLSFSLRDLKEISAVAGAVFAVGLPAAIYVTTSSLANIVFNHLLAGFGDVTVAAAGVAKKIDVVPLNVCLGLSHGVIPLLAFNYTAKNPRRMRAALRAVLGLSVGVCLACLLLFSLCAEDLVRLFIDDEATARSGGVFLPIMLAATPLMAVNIMINSLFQATGHSRESVVLSLSRQGLVNIPLMFLFRALYGVYGVVSAQLAADALTLLLSLALYARFLHRLRAAPTQPG